MAGNSTEPGRSVASKVVEILLTFTDGPGHSLTEISELTDIPISTAHRLAGELAAWGVLDRTEEGSYRVGLPLRTICTRTRYAPSIQESAGPVLEDLCAALRTDARLGILQALEVAFMEMRPGARRASPFSANAPLPAHATAMGRALLAFSPPHVIDLVIGKGLAVFTPHTLCSAHGLRRTLAVTRLTRFAVCRREMDPHSSAVASPVFAAGGHVVAALEVGLPDPDANLQMMQSALAVAARSLSRQLAASPAITGHAAVRLPRPAAVGSASTP